MTEAEADLFPVLASLERYILLAVHKPLDGRWFVPAEVHAAGYIEYIDWCERTRQIPKWSPHADNAFMWHGMAIVSQRRVA